MTSVRSRNYSYLCKVILCLCYVQMKTFTYRYFEDKFNERPFLSKFDILLRGCYLFRGMPFLRVTFIDVCKALEFIGNSSAREDIVLAKRTQLLTYDSFTGAPRLLNGAITEPVFHGLCFIIFIWYHEIIIIIII